ncbi:glycosyltransferase family 2 protein [Leeuwenhoekiella sp. MAR_2009_132]|uniref:glycosyltransferase family 2 protein n=1 Tax=Leeuwenhoekiella sp. MAR_2009_132 TaxID=1392489 RepID=UPI00048C3A83|nr:glycosyltransferase [Leeuwenhoekiella sp. MAR_2009_132]
MTLISIVIPVFNRARLIEKTLNSVRGQTLANWECIIVDDVSTDETRTITSSLIKGDNRFKLLVRSQNYKSGGNGARNMGLKHAQGTHIIFFDSDDLLHSKALKERLEDVIANPDCDCYLYKTQLFKKEPEDLQFIWNTQNPDESIEDLTRRFIEQDMPWHTNGALWTRTFLDKIGGWDEDLKVWQDWEFHIRALTQNPKLYCDTEKPDNYYRINNFNSIASSHNSESYIHNVSLALKKVEILLWDKLKKEESLRLSYNYLIVRNLIQYPLFHGMRTLPFKMVFTVNYRSLSFIRYLSKSIFIWFFSFYKMRHLAKKITYFDRLKTKSTHLKISLETTYEH